MIIISPPTLRISRQPNGIRLIMTLLHPKFPKTTSENYGYVGWAIHLVLECLPIISIAVDVIVPGCGPNDAEARIDQDCNLRAVLKSFEKHHVKLNAANMKFLIRQATFMGHLIAAEGLKPNPSTVEAILKMPTTTDKPGICRFLGATNCLSKFCPQLSSATHPSPPKPYEARHTLLVLRPAPKGI